MSGSPLVHTALAGGCSSGAHRWRWRESNPRPLQENQGFSGCSLLGVFSAPALQQAGRRRAQSLLGVPTDPATGPAGGVSLRCQIPGRRRSRADRVAPRSGGEGELGLLLVGSYLFAVTGFTRSRQQPSTRFPWLERPKSKPVTPMFSCQSGRLAGRPRVDATSITRPAAMSFPSSREPRWTRSVARPPGSTGRVGPVRTAEPPPRRGSGLITATESATPQAGSQSPVKTSDGPRLVAPTA